MKSYFAKLADRATLSNSPAAPRVNPRTIKDPFEANESAIHSISAPSAKASEETARLAPATPAAEGLDHLSLSRQRTQPLVMHAPPDRATRSETVRGEGNEPVAKLTVSETEMVRP